MTMKPSLATMTLPLRVHRSAAVAPDTLNAEARTVELVWSTGAAVARGYFEPYLEELDLSPKAVRMGRLESGTAPLLNAHNAHDVSAVIGVVESARLANGRGLARVRFAAGDEVADGAFNK